MKYLLKVFLLLTLLNSVSCTLPGPSNSYNAIYSGVQWFDDRGLEVNAHGACIIQEDGKYYLFGECHTDTSNAFVAFNCYSSSDLYNWKFENQVLTVQDTGKLGPNRVGERVKVMKCPKTNEYVMYMHTDNLAYRDPCIGYATSKKINGDYSFHAALLFNGKPIRKWDMGTFQDTDGSGYVITHSGNLYKLSEDYKSVTEQVVSNMTPQCESPAIFKKDSVYYWLGSGLTSWERNDNYYFTAKSLGGPWTERGLFAPKASLTWNSQTTYVLTIAGSIDTSYMFMGDRWSFPRQGSAASYVWQPLIVSGYSLSLPNFKESWQINTSAGTWSPFKFVNQTIDNTDSISIHYSGKWIHSSTNDTLSVSRSDSEAASFSLGFSGTQIGFYGVAGPGSGYAQVILQNSKEKIILSTIIDLYSKYPEASLKFLSPLLPKDNYTITITVMGEHGNWWNKKGTKFGSTGNFVSLDRLVITK